MDSNYELPVAYSLTKASTSDIKEGHKMINNIKETKIEILDKCETFEGDRGYDDTNLIKELWDIYEIKPIIDIRNM